MIQLPTKPWNEGDTFTNDTTGVEYTFDGVKWLASGGEELDLSGFVSKSGDTMTGALETPHLKAKNITDGEMGKVLVEGWVDGTDEAAQILMSNKKYNDNNAYGSITFQGENGNGWFSFDRDVDFSSKGLHSVTRIRLIGDKTIREAQSTRIRFSGKVEIPRTGDDKDGFVLKGKTEEGSDGNLLSAYHNSSGIDAVNYRGKQESPSNLATVGYVNDSYVKKSDSWDMSLGTSLGVNMLKPLDDGTPFVYYEPRDWDNTHPCGIVNRGLMQNYVGEEIAKVGSSQPELPKFKLVASDPRDWGDGSFVVLDSNGADTRSLESTRTIFISAFDVDGKRWARDRDGIEYARTFNGHINVLLQNGDKTIFTMSPHYNAKCQMGYFPGNEENPNAGYVISWQGVLSHTETSDTSVWNVGAFYRFSIPEIFF